MEIRPIKNDADHRAALQEIDRLWNSPNGSIEADRLDILVSIVQAYEEKQWPIEPEGDPIEVLIAHMDVTGRTQSDLAALLGSRSRASEVLSRKRPLTLAMIQKFSMEWGIAAELLVQPYELAAA